MHAIQSTRPLSPSTRTWAGKGGVCKLTTIQRQHSQRNRLNVLGTPDPKLANHGHAMSKQSRARSHHSLCVSDPRWATPTPTPLGQKISPTLPGSQPHPPTPKGHVVLQPALSTGCQISETSPPFHLLCK
ncbi:hypothetical protein AVEN_28547-1 [Araneus ventricosus]|uniref:Uncharacterized protein n=1 Tax=Araneus ventricosus TaxID=182803 RepID=A0A4Y2BCD5_ARAVE|nr:hypothetical protein AVEN_28547-1 [Araneus ventricosus]